MSAQDNRHTLFHPEVFKSNDEFKFARLYVKIMNTEDDPNPSEAAKKAYDTVLKRLMDNNNISEAAAEEKLEKIIQDETYHRAREAELNVGACTDAAVDDVQAGMPRVQQMLSHH